MELLKRIITKIFSVFGRESSSYILAFPKSNSFNNLKSEDFEFISNSERAINFLGGLRLESRNYKDWLAKGSLLVIKTPEKYEPSPRGWVHFNGSRNISGFECFFDKVSAWIGPDFVPIKYRGYGIQKLLIEQRMSKVFSNENIRILFTGINISNIPSLKNYIKCGFQIVGLLRSKRFLFWKFSQKLIYSDFVEKHLHFI